MHLSYTHFEIEEWREVKNAGRMQELSGAAVNSLRYFSFTSIPGNVRLWSFWKYVNLFANYNHQKSYFIKW